MQSILVKDYMDHNPHAIHVNTPIRDVVATLVKAKILGAPVVDDDKNVVGFVSEQDCIKAMLNDAFFCEDSPGVNTVMKTGVLTVSPETSVLEIAETMAQRPPKNYPVVEGGRLVGLISRSAILQALLQNSEDCYIHQ